MCRSPSRNTLAELATSEEIKLLLFLAWCGIQNIQRSTCSHWLTPVRCQDGMWGGPTRELSTSSGFHDWHGGSIPASVCRQEAESNIASTQLRTSSAAPPSTADRETGKRAREDGKKKRERERQTDGQTDPTRPDPTRAEQNRTEQNKTDRQRDESERESVDGTAADSRVTNGRSFIVRSFARNDLLP